MFSMFQNIQTLHITSVSSHCFIFLGIKTVEKNCFKLNGNGMILTMNMQSSSTREGETQGKSLITLYNDAGMSLQMRRLQEILYNNFHLKRTPCRPCVIEHGYMQIGCLTIIE